MSLADPLYLYGPTWSGKTSLIKQLAARLNYSVFEATGHERLELADLVGHLSVSKGTVHFEYGPLNLAMRYGGLVLFNELDLTSPAVAAGLNSVLDGEPLCIPENGGELVVPHPRFRFCATGNSNGGSDETGLYQGIQRQNAAFLDRFILCEVGYPPPDVEKNLLNDVPTAMRDLVPNLPPAEKVIWIGQAVRKGLYETLIEWICGLAVFHPKAAARLYGLKKVSPDCQNPKTRGGNSPFWYPLEPSP